MERELELIFCQNCLLAEIQITFNLLYEAGVTEFMNKMKMTSRKCLQRVINMYISVCIDGFY